MHFVIFSGGKIRPSRFITSAIKSADIILAADQGAASALKFKIIPKAVIGDFDSLTNTLQKKLKKLGSTFISSPQEKNETDTELAIHYALKQGAKEITIIGGVEGDRLDHIIANIFLMSGGNLPLTFINGAQKMWTEVGSTNTSFSGNPDDLLSLIPLTQEVREIQTSGLKYRLNKESLFQKNARGVSNVFSKKQVTVSFEKGTLLFIQTSQ